MAMKTAGRSGVVTSGKKEGDENAEERGLDLLNNSQLLETIVDFIQHCHTICSNS